MNLLRSGGMDIGRTLEPPGGNLLHSTARNPLVDDIRLSRDVQHAVKAARDAAERRSTKTPHPE